MLSGNGRVAESATHWEAVRAGREAAGVQPPLWGADPVTLLVANVVYLLVTFVLFRVMRAREQGFKLKPVLLVYNATCIAAAGYVVYGIAAHKLYHPGSFSCNEHRTDEAGQRLAFFFWVFYAQKFWEFLDTWFFILRRSFRQVTFLHVFHHSSITVVVGSIVPYDFSSDMFLPIFLNAVVHVLMYSHYLVTALGFRGWWSRYLTSMQLAQFCLISLQSALAWNAGPACGSPDWAKLLMVVYMGSMLALFGNFFLRKYVFRPSPIPNNMPKGAAALIASARPLSPLSPTLNQLTTSFSDAVGELGRCTVGGACRLQRPVNKPAALKAGSSRGGGGSPSGDVKIESGYGLRLLAEAASLTARKKKADGAAAPLG